MPALNFSKQFADAVRSGKKTQTIRKPRKRPWQVGDRLYLYTGQRTKDCEDLVGDRKVAYLVDVASVIISWDIEFVGDLPTSCFIDDPAALDKFARDDGFTDYAEMVAWFDKTHGLPFYGHLLKWELMEKNNE